MKDTSTIVYRLHKGQVKDLVKLAKDLGFKARFMPYMEYGCAQSAFGNFHVDWSTFDKGGLPEKLKAMKTLKNAMNEARLNYFAYEDSLIEGRA